MTDQDQNQTVEPTENKPEPTNEPTYTKADFEKVVAELSKFKSEAEDLRSRFKNQEIEAAKAANDWQKVAEVRQKEADEALQKLERFKSAVISDKRLSAVREEAIKAGLRKESLSDLSYLDYPEVRLQTDEEGQFKVEGADKAIQRLKTTRPHWFASAIPSVNLNTPSVTGDGGKITWDSIKKIEAEYKKNPNPANAEKYKAVLLEFKKQSTLK